ncbi:MAG TPA: hypothetical protein VJ698_13090 [Noviherbaspirillum sp.]|uniref:hypothetical protein n=1 Tax=Noviherbaspirillum sp. TaxID=1926288 RepID=UPI002B480684|nr:hypothetical protein [Noviherbaspirillum sp.]HJV86403.1 hypothetical protein [Noviherbaspirillum sp.]
MGYIDLLDPGHRQTIVTPGMAGNPNSREYNGMRQVRPVALSAASQSTIPSPAVDA